MLRLRAIAVDSEDPPALAGFWALALGYERRELCVRGCEWRYVLVLTSAVNRDGGSVAPRGPYAETVKL